MELLLEIGAEEIPAEFLGEATGSMVLILGRLLRENRLEVVNLDNIYTTGTPRRLTAVVKNLPNRQPDMVEERTGPPVKAAYDDKGKPTKAAVGFAKGAGVDIDELEKIDTPKGEYLVAKIKKPGKPAGEILAEILPRFITSIPWPKSMRWGDGDLRFARPIHWILALLDGKVIEFELEGIKAGSTTYGHRFTHPEPIKVTGYEDYIEKLRDANVIIDHGERFSAVLKDIHDRADQLGGEPACFSDLFMEITNLVEWPVIIDAEFPEHYLDLPKEVLIASMTGHQRYVPLRGAGDNLLSCFITVANTPVDDEGVVARGNARVLNARLADAEFFYKTDRKKSLEEHAQELKDVLYIKGMGSYADKSSRIEELAGKICEWIAPGDSKVATRARRAAKLAKADLVTLMVGEFPSLQGHMGGIYARESDEDEKVACAIEEHYLPRSAADIEEGKMPGEMAESRSVAIADRADEGKIPVEKAESCAVAIADRADSLAACFALGLTPKGDRDPYALRRAVLGILAIIQQRQLNLSLSDLLDAAAQGVAANSKKEAKELLAEMLEFVRERIRHQLISGFAKIAVRAFVGPAPPKSDDVAPDTAEAVLRSGFDDYLDVVKKAWALNRFRERPDFDDLATSFRRVGNILEDFHTDKVDESLFKEPEEKELWEKFCNNRDRVGELAQEREYLKALEAMAELRPAVDKFFDEVLVNDPEDPERRANRHSLLYAIHRSFLAVADFSAISRPGV